MEYCEHKDLRDNLETHGRLPEADTTDIARQLLAGLCLMREAGFAHRDIKPANVFVKSAPPAHLWVKLGDLGLTKRAEAVSGSSTVRATPGFVPPELYGLTREDPKHIDPFYSDVWCFAETVHRILADRETFDSFIKLNEYVDHHIPFLIEALVEVNTSELGTALSKCLMAPLPLERMTTQKALEHPWVLLDGDTESVREDMASVQGDSPMASVSSIRDEEITQFDPNWTSDIETAHLGALSELYSKFADVDGQTARDAEQLTPCDSMRTNHVAYESNDQAYVADIGGGYSAENITGIFPRSPLADAIMSSVPEVADGKFVGNLFTEQRVEETTGAESHLRTNSTGEIPVSSSNTYASDSAPSIFHPQFAGSPA